MTLLVCSNYIYLLILVKSFRNVITLVLLSSYTRRHHKSCDSADNTVQIENSGPPRIGLQSILDDSIGLNESNIASVIAVSFQVSLN